MSVTHATPLGDPAREAIASLRGYVYQIYQSALAWTEIKSDEFLYLEVAEDFAVVATNALQAVQVKETASRVTINSDDVVASIDRFILLQENNPSLNVSLRHLTTSVIGKEKSPENRIGETPTLIAWRNLAKAGDLSDLRRVLENSKLSDKSKKHIANLNDSDLREKFLKKIHFDCGAPDSSLLERLIISRISKLIRERDGVHSQAVNCTTNILLFLLKLSTNKNRNDRFVDRPALEECLEAATQITLNRAQFDAHSRLIGKALSASLSAVTDFSGPQSIKPSPVSNVPLPKALASRSEELGKLLQSLERIGICWISGAAGMGKTIAARVVAHRNEGVWASINLRAQAGEQAAFTLAEVANEMPNYGLRGLIVDDLDCSLESSVLDNLHYLFCSASRTDLLLVVTSANPPTSEFLFASGLGADINTSLTEFTKKDIKEILEKIGVGSENWTNYTHLASGGGHPQLAIAFIQSMAATGWNPNEFLTLNALFTGSPAVNDVRKRTRERLLRDLPETARRLIERLSLKVGGFSRELAIDLGKVAPSIQDAGIVLESLTGSWIDQHEGERFSLSPLLSDYAAKTLTTDEKETIQSAIADSLTKGRRLDVIDMNSALLAALHSRNKVVILKLCMAVLGSDNDEIQILAPHLSIFRLFRTDITAYPSDAATSHIFRGVQLLLLTQESDPFSKLEDALRCFSEEGDNVENEAMRVTTNLMVYSKLLLQTSKAELGVNFVGVIRKLDQILQNENRALPDEAQEVLGDLQKKETSLIGFMFLNQVHQLSKIEDLSTVFDFLDSSSPDLRSRLLAPFAGDDFEIDMLVTGAWLSEHDSNTIAPHVHSAIFSQLEKQAVGWNHANLAVCCRKYQAIILDEYGDNKESALALLDDGLTIYGATNSELVRAKAKILYRAEDHEGSLALSKALIEGDAPLSEVEKAFLGREAAISAEKQGDFETARRYYLYGSDASNKSNLPDMAAMRVGLLADAALASWHDGDRLTCLQEFVAVLRELNQFAPDETLRTAHCHAVTRHVLLWLDQDTTGQVRLQEDDQKARIYPGCVSNPAPHPEIRDRFDSPIEMAWYMLARVENHASLDAGITENLELLLPNGPVLEGQMLLSSAKMHKSMTRLDVILFIDALKDTISSLTYTRASGKRSGGFDIMNVTFGTFPEATKEQQEELIDLTEKYVLLFLAMCILKEDLASFEDALPELHSASGFVLRPALMEQLEKGGSIEDYNQAFAQLVRVHASGLSESRLVSPAKVFELAFKVLQLASITSNYRLFAENLLSWLEKRWAIVLERQRFLLTNPSLHEDQVKKAIERNNPSSEIKVVDILSVMLPMLGLSDQNELERFLSTLRNK
jgi:hypothetical protein